MYKKESLKRKNLWRMWNTVYVEEKMSSVEESVFCIQEVISDLWKTRFIRNKNKE